MCAGAIVAEQHHVGEFQLGVRLPAILLYAKYWMLPGRGMSVLYEVLTLDHLSLHVRSQHYPEKSSVRRRHGEVIALLQPSAELVQRQMRPDRCWRGLHHMLGRGGRLSAERVRVEEAEQNLLLVQDGTEIPAGRSHTSRYIGHAIV